MAPTRQRRESEGRTFQDDVRELFSVGNPNPTRTGCPTRETLIALAERARPAADPAYEHLVNCSPCYREFKAFQTVQVERADPSAMTAGARWLALAAMTLLIAGLAASWFVTTRRSSGDGDSRA
jgi:hypothetical protein